MVKLETEEAYAYYLQRRPQLLELGTFHTLPKSMLYKLIHQVTMYCCFVYIWCIH